jgi:hypothetical protein
MITRVAKLPGLSAAVGVLVWVIGICADVR